ncbi:MAG: hypothetical protein GTO41_10495, partial [Burkholderiales bacterium]|nr:hypothetical protein [Burkholderiales bacterium]
MTVNVTNFGNLDVRKLPRTEDATTAYESGQYVQLQSKQSASDALAFVRKKLTDAGYTEVRNAFDTEDDA